MRGWHRACDGALHAAVRARRSARPPSLLLARVVIAFSLVASVIACSGADDTGDDGDGEDGEDTYASTDSALSSAGPCSGKAIDRAVKCAQAKGARVLSFYRSPADQERVRRENHCTNRCTGSAGCVSASRATARCERLRPRELRRGTPA